MFTVHGLVGAGVVLWIRVEHLRVIVREYRITLEYKGKVRGNIGVMGGRRLCRGKGVMQSAYISAYNI